MTDVLLVDLWNDDAGETANELPELFLMSSEDFENLACLFGPAVNNRNINFRNAISDGKLGSNTETSCN